LDVNLVADEQHEAKKTKAGPDALVKANTEVKDRAVVDGIKDESSEAKDFH